VPLPRHAARRCHEGRWTRIERSGQSSGVVSCAG
jgi:hypothetical protein